MKPITDTSPSRFVAFDLHKHYVVVAGVNRDQEVVLKPRRLAIGELASWAQAHLLPNDQIMLEATGNAWTVYDWLAPLVQRCVVADARQVKWIANAAVKLLRLKLGHDLTRFTYSGMPRALASEAEVLARFPELAEQA